MIVQEPVRLSAEELARRSQSPLDFDDLIADLDTEIAYLNGDIDYLATIIPTIDGMTTLVQLRGVLKGLAERMRRTEQENRRILKAIRFISLRLPR